MSKQRKGFPSETHVKRGRRFIKGGEIELTEKLGRPLLVLALPLRFAEPVVWPAA